jgi:predicted DNA-binding protein (UPF0251 family)
MLEEVNLTLDELEAIRLADSEGLYQEDAAKKMNISRQTFGNIVNSAHKKIADVLLHAKALRIEGGVVEMDQSRKGRTRRAVGCEEVFHTAVEKAGEKPC